jgi:hypothetical protein
MRKRHAMTVGQRLKRARVRMTRLGRVQWLMLTVLFALGVILLFGAEKQGEGVIHSVLREAGVVTIGTVLVSLVYEFILRPEHDTHLLDVIKESLINRSRSYGLSGIQKVTAPRLFRRLDAQDELYWLDTHCPDLADANVKSAMIGALEKGASIRVLVIDPDSATARARAKEIAIRRGFQADAFQADARQSLALVRECRESLPSEQAERLEIRTYNGLPCAPIYLHLRGGQPLEGWTSYYLSWPTYETAHLYWTPPSLERLPAGPGLGLEAFHTYFDLKWAPAIADGSPGSSQAVTLFNQLGDSFAELRARHYAFVVALIEQELRGRVLTPMHEVLADGKLHRGQNATTRRLLLELADRAEIWLVHSTSENHIFRDVRFWLPFFQQLETDVEEGRLVGVRRLFVLDEGEDPDADPVLREQIEYHSRTPKFSYRLLSREAYEGIQGDEVVTRRPVHDFGIYGPVAYVWLRPGYAERLNDGGGYFQVDASTVESFRVLHRRCWEAGVEVDQWPRAPAGNGSLPSGRQGPSPARSRPR